METNQKFRDNNVDITINQIDKNPECARNLLRDEVLSDVTLNDNSEIQLTLICPKINEGHNTEEPIDLTFSQKHRNIDVGRSLTEAQLMSKLRSEIPSKDKLNLSEGIPNIIQANQTLPSSNVPKKRGRKRKNATAKIGTAINLSTPAYDNQDYLQAMESRQAEVLIAAKSLFSKRTRTLYHWMYPNTPKAQLKSAVSLSWETLGVQEKEFYVSQVLGRFGFPQSSLMVNPQLGGLRGIPITPPFDLSSPTRINAETRNAVSMILENPNRQNEAGSSWSQYNFLPHQMRKLSKKCSRTGRPPSKNIKLRCDENVGPVTVETISEDFQDDPELRKEFEQFNWALHMSDK